MNRIMIIIIIKRYKNVYMNKDNIVIVKMQVKNINTITIQIDNNSTINDMLFRE